MACPRRGAGRWRFLPFQMRFYIKSGKRHYVVSKVMHGFKHQAFEPGAEILNWGGFPVDNIVSSDPRGTPVRRQSRCEPQSRHVSYDAAPPDFLPASWRRTN